MIKRIPVEFVSVGMYVSDLNAAWIPHSNVRKQGLIKSEAVIEKIKKMGISEIYIDSSLGKDCQDALTKDEVDSENHAALEKVSSLAPLMKPKLDLNEEMLAAGKVHNAAVDLVANLVDGVKSNQPIEVDSFESVADGMLDSVLRNHNALCCLGRIREKDSYLMEHSVNLAVLMSVFGKSLELDRSVMKPIAIGAMLHDIGKILVPDDVLHKPAKLTDAEFEIIKQHAQYSRELLEKTKGMPELAITVAAQHHEKMDGTGYPLGLKGCDISPFGRMAAIVDVYDAITADRVYHRGMPPTAALKKLLEWSNHLDPSLVNHFIRCIGIYPVGSAVLLDSGRIGVVTQANDDDQRLPTVKIIYHTKFKSFVKVINLDLAKPNVQDRILRAIDPHDYQINIRDFL